MSVRYTATWYDVTQALQEDTHHTHRHVPARPAGLQFSHSQGCQPALYKAGFQKTGLFEKKLASENCRPCDRP